MINFQKGNFIQFEATTTIHLGRLERNLSSGDVVEFDGVTLRLGGQETSMPELKAGIKRGWLKLFEAKSALPSEVVVESKPTPKKSSEMQVERIYDEEKSVSTIKETTPVKKETQTLEEKYPIQNSMEDNDVMDLGGFTTSRGADVSTASSSSDSSVSESQSAETVNLKLKTASQNKTVLSDSSQVSQEIASLENIEADMPIVEREEAPLVEDETKEMTQILQAVDGDVTADQGAVQIGEDNSNVVVLACGVEWDKSKHWSKRGQLALDLYGHDQSILDEIMAIESAGVVKAIKKGMA
jgi:hypothetical protein